MEFLLIASAHFMALLSPGPDFFLILQTSLRLPLRYAFAVCLGIALANGLYLSLAVTALEAMKHMNVLLDLLKYLGGGYLLYIGVLMIRAPVRPLEERADSKTLSNKHLGRQFVVGFMSAILNPKNAIFYFSLFTVMVSDQTPFTIRVLYGIWMTSVVLCWDIGLACLLGNSRVKKALTRWFFFIEKGAGCMLALFGLLLSLR